jgi:hypothetical protein
LDRQQKLLVIDALHSWMGAAMSEYRKKAEECLRAAEKMRDTAQRIAMLSIARNYMSSADFARQADRIDKNLEIQNA